MSLLARFTREESTLVREDRLGNLIREACTLGTLRIWQYTKGFSNMPDQDFRVTILFEFNQTKVEVEHRAHFLEEALASAIAQARRVLALV